MKTIQISFNLGGSFKHYIFNEKYEYKYYFSSAQLTEEEIDKLPMTNQMTEEQFNNIYDTADFKGSWTK